MPSSAMSAKTDALTFSIRGRDDAAPFLYRIPISARVGSVTRRDRGVR